ncbi:MAG: NADH dehydrogenase subunit [Bacteroidota bacterium]|nr:NADH dehydrogenase subunit [Bacteroidota bacterium]
MINYINIVNNGIIPFGEIPVLQYDDFVSLNLDFLKNESNHCVIYYGLPVKDNIQLISCIADDFDHNIKVFSSIIKRDDSLISLSSENLAFEKFEREISENFGIVFYKHPRPEPIRYSIDMFDKSKSIENYRFYDINSEQLHEVGVGPVHAGIIEPGYFRFICNGEKILHLEIQLGYQHRGVEKLFIDKKNINQLTILSESIAGDSVAGHSTSFINLHEVLSGYTRPEGLNFVRTIAQEIERIALNTGNLSNLSVDIAYQLGNAVLSRLRTPIINFFQEWCGNRTGRGLIREADNYFPFNEVLKNKLLLILTDYEKDFKDICENLFHLPSALSRFEKTGIITVEQSLSSGFVGTTARVTGLKRDIRSSHPYNYYKNIEHQPVIKRHGDVYSRARIRRDETLQSIEYIRNMLENVPDTNIHDKIANKLYPNMFGISLTEDWRGEICHTAITDEMGKIKHYKLKDPSFHNWLALALCVRNNEISDFPVCNKSFDLSYCGHDL